MDKAYPCPQPFYPHAQCKGRLICSPKSFVQPSASIDCSGNVTIGEGTYIGHRVCILTHFHKTTPKDKTIRKAIEDKNYIQCTNLTIEGDVLINQDVFILAQVRKIGRGAYVGAKAVVTKDVPPYEIWAGNPARKVGERK